MAEITKTKPETNEVPLATTMALSEKETKQILTPFAFEINKTLFGLPLALPWRRGCALLIDFILIVLLAETPGEFLALLVAITFFRLGSKKRAQQLGKKRGLRKLFLRLVGSLMILIVLLSTVPAMIDGSYWQSTSESQINQEENKTEAATNDSKSKSEPGLIYKGIEWAKGAITDLGLSFGWAALYFSVLTAVWHGQTPGKKLLNIRVVQLDGTPLSIWDSFGRYGGYGAGLATGLLGFIQIYWDANRQAIHDKISSTIVIDVKEAEKVNHTGRYAGLRTPLKKGE